MAKAAKVQPAPEPQLSLADQIRAVQEAAEEFIMSKALEVKAGDGKKLPIGVIRQMITRGDSCKCRATLALLEKEKK